MQVNPGADYARIDHIVLNDSQDTKEQQDHQRHKFQETGDQPQHERARHSYQGKAHARNHADQNTGCQLRANISRQGAVDILEELVTPPTESSARQHSQRRTAKAVSILQKKEAEDRNQHQPGQVDDQPKHPLDGYANDFAAFSYQPEPAIVHRLNYAFRHAMLHEIL